MNAAKYIVKLNREGGFNPILNRAVLVATQRHYNVVFSGADVSIYVGEFCDFLSLILAGIRYLSNYAAIVPVSEYVEMDDNVRKMWFSRIYSCLVFSAANDKWYNVEVWHDWQDICIRYCTPCKNHVGHDITNPVWH